MDSKIPLFNEYLKLKPLYEEQSQLESIFRQIQNIEKENLKNQWIKKRVNELLVKQHEIKSEKQLVDQVYKNSSLSEEEHKILINQDYNVDNSRFIMAFEKLLQQEKVAQEIDVGNKYKNVFKQIQKKIQSSKTTKNLALAKILKLVYQGDTEVLKKFATILDDASALQEQYIFRKKQQIQFSLDPIIFFQQLPPIMEDLRQEIQDIFPNANSINLLHQILDEQLQESVQTIEKSIAQIKDYFISKLQLYGFIKIIQVNEVCRVLDECSNYIQGQEQLKQEKLQHSQEAFKQKTIQYFQQQLMQTRFNIGVFSSYEPIEQHVEKVKEYAKSKLISQLIQFLSNRQRIRPFRKNKNVDSPYIEDNPTKTCLKQRESVQQKFGLNAYEIIKDLDQQAEKAIDNLIHKLASENLFDVINQYGLDTVKEDIQKKKDNPETIKKVFSAILRYQTEQNKSLLIFQLVSQIQKLAEFFYELEFIRNDEYRKISLTKNFIDQYYHPLFELLQQKVNEEGDVVWNEQFIKNFASQIQINQKELLKKDLSNIIFNDEQTENVILMNST